MKTLNSGDKYALVAEINMIPFIDVALVLLIIFMVMTPFLVRAQIKINLPKAHAVETSQTKNNQVQISVTRSGAIYLDGKPTASDAVEAALKRLLPDAANQMVIVSADREVAFEKVVTVMDAAKRCGAGKLGVCVKQDKEKN